MKASKHFPIFIACGVLVLGVSISFATYWSEEIDNVKQIKHSVDSASADIMIHLFDTLNPTLNAIERIASRWEAAKGTPKEQWKDDTRQYIKHHDYIQAIEWVDKNNIVRWITPMKTNRAALNFDLSTHPQRNQALEKSKLMHAMYLSEVVELKQGGQGLLAFSPIFFDGEHQGFILAVFKVDELLESLMKKRGFDYEVFENNKKIASASLVGLEVDKRTFEARKNSYLVKKQFKLRNLIWDFHFWPNEVFMSRSHTSSIHFPSIFLGISTILLSILTFLFLSLRESEKQIRKLQLKAAEKERAASLGVMAGGIAHEINNPLSIIQGLAETTEIYIQQNEIENASKQISKVKNTVDRISGIVKSMLMLSRDFQRSNTDYCDAERVSDMTRQLVSHQTFKRDVELSFSNNIGSNSIHCNPGQLVQVLVNLISNSVDAIAENNCKERWVNVSFLPYKENLVRINVKDSGPGIKTEDRANIMEPFFTTKEVNAGTGLGLSLSKGLIEKNGGKLFYNSSCEFTCFTIDLEMQRQGSDQVA